MFIKFKKKSTNKSIAPFRTLYLRQIIKNVLEYTKNLNLL